MPYKVYLFTIAPILAIITLPFVIWALLCVGVQHILKGLGKGIWLVGDVVDFAGGTPINAWTKWVIIPTRKALKVWK